MKPKNETRQALVPPLAELGVPGCEVSSWYGLLAPAQTPEAVIQRLQQEFGAQIKADFDRWAQVVKDANLKE
jgi:tripartite-type tricarboxylate transporter receptor subunit TctC